MGDLSVAATASAREAGCAPRQRAQTCQSTVRQPTHVPEAMTVKIRTLKASSKATTARERKRGWRPTDCQRMIVEARHEGETVAEEEVAVPVGDESRRLRGPALNVRSAERDHQ